MYFKKQFFFIISQILKFSRRIITTSKQIMANLALRVKKELNRVKKTEKIRK